MFKQGQTPDLPKTLEQEILHNSKDMNQFYTLTTEERDDVLERICLHNSSKELKAAVKKKT